MSFNPYMLGRIDEAGYNGIRQEHIDAVARTLKAAGLTEIDWHSFSRACHQNGIDPHCFSQADLDQLQKAMQSVCDF